jgi:hypothetical protein
MRRFAPSRQKRSRNEHPRQCVPGYISFSIAVESLEDHIENRRQEQWLTKKSLLRPQALSLSHRPLEHTELGFSLAKKCQGAKMYSSSRRGDS